jgi:thiol:disulfide interchange protein DsbA
MHTPRWYLLALLIVAIPAGAEQPVQWKQGQNYFLVQPAQPTNVPAGKVEVTEVFSYACPACYQFYPFVDKIRVSLPKSAQLDYLPAAFNPSEDWPMFQRAFYAAQALGIVDKTHDAMFNAVWKTSELAVVDEDTHRLKSPPPSIENAADFYNRVAGVSKQQFLAAANSFAVDVKMKRADALVIAYGADATPTMIVNGKYRLTVQSAGGYDQTIALVKWLVDQETPR